MYKTFVRIQCELPMLQSIGWSVLSGLMGILILTGFFVGIMSLETLSSLLPLVVGFNAAISGYMLIERGAGSITHKKTMSAVVGTMIAVLSVVSVNGLAFRMGGFYLISAFQGLAALSIGMSGGWAGGLLAIKYQRLKSRLPAR